MFADLVQCTCQGPMRLETAMPGITPGTLLLTFACPLCDKHRRFILSEVEVFTTKVDSHDATKLRDTI